MRQKLNHIVKDYIQKGISQSLAQYTNIPPEQRHEQEQQGYNIIHYMHENIAPAILNCRVKDVLIIMEEGIGNMILLTPALKLLRQKNPRLNITVWGKESSLEVIKNWGVVDNLITKFDNRAYDLCYVTIWGHQTAQQHENELKTYCRHIIFSRLEKYHEAIQNMYINGFLDNDIFLPETHVDLATEQEYKELKKLMDKEINGKFIVFGDTLLRNFGWENKRWPYYHDLAKLIDKKFPEYKIVLIGDNEDKHTAETKEWPKNTTLAFMGKTNIRQLASLIKEAEFYVGNDTGPTHIAAAVGTKTYAIFGPTLVSKNKPLGNDVTILNKKLPCSPCQYTEKFLNCECMNYYSAQEVYDHIFFPKPKKRTFMLVGKFSGGAHRNELYIKRTLEKYFKCKVIAYDYFVDLNKNKNPIETTYNIINKALHEEPDDILICGGRNVVSDIIGQLEYLLPKTKTRVWYVDQRGQVEPWFHELSSVCDYSYWSTGDPVLLSQVFAKTQKPCEFLPISPSSDEFYPIECEKDIDVLFLGTPHSKPRIDLLTYLVNKGINVQIYGDGDWPEHLKKYTHKGVYGPEANKLVNRSKVMVNINNINNVPLYFSDRYFFPMAVKTVGLNQRIPQIEDMFEDSKHMVFFDNFEDCCQKIQKLLEDEALREKISEEGYKIYKEKYDMKHLLERIINE